MASESSAWKDCPSKMQGFKCRLPSPRLSTAKKRSSKHKHYESAPYDGLHDDILDSSHQTPDYVKIWNQVNMSNDGNGKQTAYNLKILLNQEIMHLERMLQDQRSLRGAFEKALGYRSTNFDVSNSLAIPKPAAELIKEIAVLELEVMHLEQYLLSLYRTAFDHHRATLPSANMDRGSMSPLTFQAGSLQHVNFARHPHQRSLYSNSCPDAMNQCHDLDSNEMERDSGTPCSQISVSHGSTDSEKEIFPLSCENSRSISTCHSEPISLMKDTKNVDSGLRSLADHLGTSISDHVPETPDRLSEDVVRCMGAIFCKLANPPLPNLSLTASPTSSLSCATFSPQDQCDNWSPQCTNEAMINLYQHDGLKESPGPYSAMIEVPWICVDSERLSYAAQMLQNFRSLVQRLEKVNPRMMRHEEKLAFWINIHNALVMHAYLAYGIPHNNVKRASLLLKATYNVGGHSINPYVIQNSILGCRSQRPTMWLRTLLSPGPMFRGGIDRHIYALEHPEPLLHFALCSGGYSDPAVRVYTAKKIRQELEQAKEEFIQATISIRKETKVILPKILDYFSKDASLNLAYLLEMIHGCVPEPQQKAIQRCLQGKPLKSVEWLPYDSSFRYIIHRDLSKG